MDISKMIKRLLLECDSTAADLAARLGSTPQNISQRVKRNTWSVADLEQIAGAYGCGLVVGFILPDGQTLTQQIEPSPERMSGTPAPVPETHPAAEQPAPKPKQPEQSAREDLLEQQKKKLAEQSEEIKRREAEKAEAEARKEAERQQREKEAQEFLRQFVEQFNREQARLAGAGKPFKEWRDLYDQDQNDILHAASFRDYREVSTLQELTPRERKARGFPLFDEKPKNF